MFATLLALVLSAFCFAGLAAWGQLTRQDLCDWQSILFPGVLFLFTAMLLAGVVFRIRDSDVLWGGFVAGCSLALVACNAESIRETYRLFQGDAELLEKASVFAALALYFHCLRSFFQAVCLLQAP